MERQQRGIQSIEAGGQLLFALVAEGRPLTLSELARAAGMPAARAHPYLVSFQKIGVVEQDVSTGRYELGPLALHLGLASLERLNPVRAAVPVIEGLAEEIDQTVFVAIWTGHGPVIVRVEASSRPVYVNTRVGSVMSLLNTATGRVFAAYLPPKVMEGLIKAELARSHEGEGSGAGPSWQQIERSLAQVRARGLARSVGETIPGINGLAAPVFDATGAIVMAITAMGPAGTFDSDWTGPIAQALRERAALVSQRLGYQSQRIERDERQTADARR